LFLICFSSRKILESYSKHLKELGIHLGDRSVVSEEFSTDSTSLPLHYQATTTDFSAVLLEIKKFIVRNIAQSFYDQVVTLLGTVKQMDTALQRRAAVKSAQKPGTESLSDSDKIGLQVKLDVESFGEEIKQLGVDPSQISIFMKLVALSNEPFSEK
jgi:hypothetical protein